MDIYSNIIKITMTMIDLSFFSLDISVAVVFSILLFLDVSNLPLIRILRDSTLIVVMTTMRVLPRHLFTEHLLLAPPAPKLCGSLQGQATV